MLSAAQRLRRSRDFRDTVRRGRRAGSPGRRLVVHVSLPGQLAGQPGPAGAQSASGPPTSGPPTSGPPTRAGVVVSRAVGGAVVRSTVKRRLRHLLRARLGELAPGTALVVRALPPAASATSAELDQDLAAALGRSRSRGPQR